MRNTHVDEGHRGRLRQKFLQNGLNAFLDYEIVELLLTLGTPRKDCKQVAKSAIKKFYGLRGVLDATLEELQQIKGIGPTNAFGIKLFQALSERYLKEKAIRSTTFISPKEIAEYLRIKLGRRKKEYFFVILLDAEQKLIEIEEISKGTINESLVHPREVFKNAIQKLATGIIVAHNHPSGNLEPSSEDLQITQRIASVGELVGIELVDHIIVSVSGYISLKESGLI